MKTLRERHAGTPEIEERMRYAVDLRSTEAQLRYYVGSVLDERSKPREAEGEYEAALRLVLQQRRQVTSARWGELGLWLSCL